jgi:3'-phosphoadenosine 5'-phosphosulfate sulfotransferase (PAPS reductase)/FAD synthetase
MSAVPTFDAVQATVSRATYGARPPRLTYLEALEAESIYIIREAVAETDNPVLLYSIGKDSSVLLHLALKAFYPAKPPFPLLHIDTTWKFRDVITVPSCTPTS